MAGLFKRHQTVSWEHLPDLDLYMDQVVTYAQKQLELYQSAQPDKLATPAILSNYVKSGLVPRPVKKKYGKEHLAAFLMMCTLKQVLPIQQSHQLMNGMAGKEFFALFGELQDQAFGRMGEEITAIAGSPETIRRQILRLALEANASRLAAQLLLQKLDQEKEKAGHDDQGHSE